MANSTPQTEKIKKASHILMGSIILVHAYEKFEGQHKSYLFFVLAGIIFLSIAVFHHPLKRKFPWVDNLFFIIEAVLSFIIAYDYFHMGKVGLPYVYLAAGVGQLIALFVFLRRSKLPKK